MGASTISPTSLTSHTHTHIFPHIDTLILRNTPGSLYTDTPPRKFIIDHIAILTWWGTREQGWSKVSNIKNRYSKLPHLGIENFPMSKIPSYHLFNLLTWALRTYMVVCILQANNRPNTSKTQNTTSLCGERTKEFWFLGIPIGSGFWAPYHESHNLYRKDVIGILFVTNKWYVDLFVYFSLFYGMTTQWLYLFESPLSKISIANIHTCMWKTWVEPSRTWTKDNEVARMYERNE